MPDDLNQPSRPGWGELLATLAGLTMSRGMLGLPLLAIGQGLGQQRQAKSQLEQLSQLDPNNPMRGALQGPASFGQMNPQELMKAIQYGRQQQGQTQLAETFRQRATQLETPSFGLGPEGVGQGTLPPIPEALEQAGAARAIPQMMEAGVNVPQGMVEGVFRTPAPRGGFHYPGTQFVSERGELGVRVPALSPEEEQAIRVQGEQLKTTILQQLEDAKAKGIAVPPEFTMQISAALNAYGDPRKEVSRQAIPALEKLTHELTVRFGVEERERVEGAKLKAREGALRATLAQRDRATAVAQSRVNNALQAGNRKLAATTQKALVDSILKDMMGLQRRLATELTLGAQDKEAIRADLVSLEMRYRQEQERLVELQATGEPGATPRPGLQRPKTAEEFLGGFQLGR